MCFFSPLWSNQKGILWNLAIHIPVSSSNMSAQTEESVWLLFMQYLSCEMTSALPQLTQLQLPAIFPSAHHTILFVCACLKRRNLFKSSKGFILRAPVQGMSQRKRITFCVWIVLQCHCSSDINKKGWKYQCEARNKDEYGLVFFPLLFRHGGEVTGDLRAGVHCSLKREACLMIYYFMPPWKSKWILESAHLLNPDLEECDLWKWHEEPTVYLSKHVWKQHPGLITHIRVMYSQCFIFFSLSRLARLLMLFKQDGSQTLIRLMVMQT